MTALLPSDRDDLQTRFLDDDVFNDPMSEYFEGPTTTSKFLPFRPPPASPIYTPTLSSRSSDAPSDAESDEIALPAFETEDVAAQDDRVFSSPSDPSTPKTTAANMTPTDGLDPFGALSRTASDDASIESEPERHVDYLSHDWREEDIWSSWRYVVSRRDRYSNGVRLENASWRTWAKSKYGLRTVSPETLNWLKDCDVTWLYGPLQTDIKTVPSSSTNDNKPPPPSELSSSNSFLDRKSILKKKTASEAILQRSLSQHTLLKHAGAILQAQKAEYSRGKPAFELATSEVGVPSDRVSSCTPSESVSSGLVSPSEKRHIHFNNEVAQCIAVEAKEWYEERDVDPSLFFLGEELDDDYAGFDEDDDTESDDGVVMMKQFNSRSPRSSSSSSLSLSTAATPHIGFRSASRSSSSSESKTIAPLPPTTLKCRSDTPEPIPPPWSQPYQNNNHGDTSPDSTKLSPTPSVETLRPSRPEANFLLDDDDEGYRNPRVDAQWRFNRNDSQRRNSSRSSSTSNDNHYSTSSSSRDRPWFVNPEDREELENGSRGNLHLTSSGMFMPYEEGESSYTGVFGRVIDTVNTARDIAHVIWNVGWRK